MAPRWQQKLDLRKRAAGVMIEYSRLANQEDVESVFERAIEGFSLPKLARLIHHLESELDYLKREAGKADHG